MARRLAAQHGLRVYGTDEVMADHGERIAPNDKPSTTAFVSMDMDERWVNRSPEAMLETLHWFQGEGLGLIIEDLLGLPVIEVRTDLSEDDVAGRVADKFDL